MEDKKFGCLFAQKMRNPKFESDFALQKLEFLRSRWPGSKFVEQKTFFGIGIRELPNGLSLRLSPI